MIRGGDDIAEKNGEVREDEKKVKTEKRKQGRTMKLENGKMKKRGIANLMLFLLTWKYSPVERKKKKKKKKKGEKGYVCARDVRDFIRDKSSNNFHS